MTDSKTATERLREMLDNQGVDWRMFTKSGKRGYSQVETKWYVPNKAVGISIPGGYVATARAHQDCLFLESVVASPEQVIAVTLGSLEESLEDSYVSREVYEDLRDEFVWMTTFLHRMGKKCGTKDVPSLVAYVEKLEAATLESGECESQWFEMFGTPERAARTLVTTNLACDSSLYCSESDCLFKDAPACPHNCGPDDYDALLEWLRGKAVKR